MRHDPKLVEEIAHLIDDHVQGRCGESSPPRTASAVLDRLAARDIELEVIHEMYTRITGFAPDEGERVDQVHLDFVAALKRKLLGGLEDKP